MLLVTGANGFIGKHLTRALLRAGEEVVGLIEPGDPVLLSAHPKLHLVTADLRDRDAILAIEGITGVYHLGAIPRLQYNRTEEEYQAVNVQGTKNVVDLAAKRPGSRVVVVSTVEAAGPAVNEQPLTEESEPRPENVYGRSKLGGENIALAAGRASGVEVTVVRLPMVYGPGNVLIFSRLFKIAATGWYPRIGSRDVWMEFCNVHNAVHALRLAYASPKAPGEVFFVNDTRSYRISEVVNAVAKATGHPKGVRFVSLPTRLALVGGYFVESLAKVYPRPPVIMAQTGKPAFSRATVAWTTKTVNYIDSSKAQRVLGYTQQVALPEGVAEAVSWYQAEGMLRF